MAKRISRATGNWNAAGTWGLVNDTASLVLAYTTNPSSVTNLTTSSQASAVFNPGAITVDGFAVFMSIKSTGTNTITMELHDGSSVVASGTIAQADLPANLGWVFIKFSSSYTLAAVNHTLRLKSSSATSPPQFYTNGTAANWLRLCCTTTTGAPAAGDDMFIMGEGVITARTVTFNETTATKGDFASATDYGSGGTAPLSQWGAVNIDAGGTLTWAASAATHYTMRLSGNLVVRNGTYQQGTTGTPCPRDSSMVLGFDCAADGDYGVNVATASTFTVQGQSRTSGKNVSRAKLIADASANATTLSLGTDTGWLDNDEIFITGTSMRPGASANYQDEVLALNGNATDTTGPAYDITIDGGAGTGGGLLNAKKGTSPLNAWVGLLTRNVHIQSVTSTLMAYTSFIGSPTVDVDWCLFRYLGTSTAKAAISLTINSSCSVTFNHCAIRDAEAHAIYDNQSSATSTAGRTQTFNDGVLYNTTSGATSISPVYFGTFGNADAAETLELKNLLVCRDQNSNMTVSVAAPCDITGFVMAQTNRGVTLFYRSAAAAGGHARRPIVGDITIFSALRGIVIGSGAWFNLTDVTVWGVSNIPLYVGYGFIKSSIDSLSVIANSNSIDLSVTGGFGGELAIMSMTALCDTGPTPSSVFSVGGTGILSDLSRLVINNYNSTPSGSYVAPTNEMINGAPGRSFFLGPVFVNPTFAAGTVYSTLASMTPYSWYAVQRENGVDGATYTQYGCGKAALDETISDSGASLRVTPNTAELRIEVPLGRVTVTDGASRTINVKVRCSAAPDAVYNGVRPRLLVKASSLIGTTADTVLDTATASSDGAWETLTGTISSGGIVDDGQVEIAIDGGFTGYSAGWFNVDTLSVS